MTTGGKLKLEDGIGGHYAGFKAPDTALVADLSWTLPPVDGTAGQALVTDGAKNLSFGPALAFPDASSALEGQIPVADGNGGVSFQWALVNLKVDLNGGFGTIPANRTGSTASWFGKNGGPTPTSPSWIPTPPTGKIFKGWTVNQNGSGTLYRSTDIVSPITAPVLLYAQYVDGYTLTYDANKPALAPDPTGTLPTESGIFNTSSVYSIKPVAKAVGVSIVGYRFLRWNTAADGGGTNYDVAEVINPIVSDITLYAIWEKMLQVTYNTNGATVGGDAPVDSNFYVVGDNFVTLDVSPFGKTGFLNSMMWNTEADGTGGDWPSGANLSITSDLTLYVKWIPAPTVTFDKNNVDATGSTDPVSHEAGSEQSLPANGFALVGYIFAGWATTAEGVVAYVDSAALSWPTEATTLYAKWASPLHVTYDASGADAPMERAVTFSYDFVGVFRFEVPGNALPLGQAVQVVFRAGEGGALPSNIVEGAVYHYNYWGNFYWPVAENGENIPYVDSGSGDLLGAVGAAPVDSNGYALNASATVKSNVGMAKTGHTFTAWNTVQGGGGTAYQPSENFQVAADTTLYAVWSPQ